MTNTYRRQFVKNISLISGIALGLPSQAMSLFNGERSLKVNIFSKHLQFLNYGRMAEVAKMIGFDGVDLTVRPNGHVEPANVQKDLPEAITAIRNEGLSFETITTAVEDASDPVDRSVLETAAVLGVKTYRMNWFRYDQQVSMMDQLQSLQKQVADLGVLNERLGLIACYQNHAGNLVGASLWEVYELLKLSDPKFFGVQYDIRHATVEGGVSWPNGLRLVQSQVKSIVLKDFKWEKIGGKWILVNTPIGEGMVDFPAFFRLIRKYEIEVPVSLHLEYPLGGAEHGHRQLSCDQGIVFEAMKNDLNRVKQYWEESK